MLAMNNQMQMTANEGISLFKAEILKIVLAKILTYNDFLKEFLDESSSFKLSGRGSAIVLGCSELDGKEKMPIDPLQGVVECSVIFPFYITDIQ
jgi:hypothetical protein